MMNPLPVAYIASQELAKASSLLPSNKQRSMLVHSLVSSMGLFSPNFSPTTRLQAVRPVRATRSELLAYHDKEFVDFILDASKQTEEGVKEWEDSHEAFGLQDDCPSFPGLSDYVQLVAGGSLVAANMLRQNKADVSICWDGGRHHAQKSHASGFCYVADCILVILALKKPLLPQPPTPSVPNAMPRHKPRVMYLDLDLHFSDGVSQAFYNPTRSPSSPTPQVLTLSIHHTSPGFFPPSPLGLSTLPPTPTDPHTLSLPLNPGFSDATYARIWDRIVETVHAAFDPDYLVVQCGVDGLAGDPSAVGNWSIGGDDGGGPGEGSMGWCVQRIMRWRGKKVFLGGGGYNSPNAARAWTYLTSIILSNPLPLGTPIPATHPSFPLYAPSFTLDVRAGNRQDLNTPEYLSSVERHFESVVHKINRQ